MNYQQTFATALFDPAQPCPAGLTAWNGSDPARRFGVYRNNVIVSLVDALADTFAVTQELVGVQFFRAMAREFAGTNPPTSPLLAFYGDTFPDFIEHFPPATGLPYLADVARIEHLRVHAYHAADLEPVHAETIAAALAEVADLPHLRLAIHPAVGVLDSIAAVFWKSGQTKIEGFAADFVTGEYTFGWPRLSDSAVALFQDEYMRPLIPPELAAPMAAFAEHLFPVLLLLGLATRFSPFALLVMTLTIQIFVYPDAYPTHGVWAAVLLFLVARGGGAISVDHLLVRRFSTQPPRMP